MQELQPIDKEVEVVEKRMIKRITFRNFLLSIFDAFNIDRGGIYTLKELLRRPGKMILAYLGLERFRYVPPFRLLIVTTALAILALGLMFDDKNNDFVRGLESTKADSESVLNAISRYANLLLWMFIPIIAAFTLLFNRKSVFNYTEHLVFNTYLYSISNLMVIFYLLDFLLGTAFFSWLTAPLLVIYYVLAYRQFFQKSWLRSSLQILAIGILSTLIYGLLGILFLGVLEKYN